MSFSDNEKCSEGHWKDKEGGNNKEGRMAGLVSHLDVWTTFTKHQLAASRTLALDHRRPKLQSSIAELLLLFRLLFFVHDTRFDHA